LDILDAKNNFDFDEWICKKKTSLLISNAFDALVMGIKNDNRRI